MKKHEGFTLVEVMIAMVILMIGMLGVMSMQYYAVAGNASSREIRVATGLGQQLVETFKITTYDDLASGNEDTVISVDEFTSSGGVDYSRTWWVLNDCVALILTDDDDTCNAGLVAECSSDPDAGNDTPTSAVRVRTCWSDKNGSDKSVTLDSIRWDKDA